jgi:hypothetical protein
MAFAGNRIPIPGALNGQPPPLGRNNDTSQFGRTWGPEHLTRLFGVRSLNRPELPPAWEG